MKNKKRRVPYVEQLQQTECGLCCVAMILRYFKSYETLQDLREYLDVGRDGIELAQLSKLMKNLNMQVKLFKTKIEGLYHMQLPAILFWNNNHFVVMEKISMKFAYIIDPAYGRKKVNLEDLSRSYSSYSLVAVPNSNFIPKKKTHNVWFDFFPILLKNKWLFFRIFIFSLIIYACTLSIPILIQNLVDNTLKNLSTNFISIGLLGIFLGIIIYSIIIFINGNELIKLRLHIDKNISVKLFDHLLKLPYKFFETRGKSDILFATNSCFVIRELFAQQIVKGVINIGAIIFIVIYMGRQSFLLVSISIILFLINIISILITRRHIIEANQYVISEQSKLQGIQIESIYSILGIKMSAIESKMFDAWQLQYNIYLSKYKNSEKLNNYINSVTELIKMASPMIILCLSIYLMTIQKISIGQILSFYSISQTFFSLSSSIFGIWNSFVITSSYLERMKDIIVNDEEDDGNIDKPICGNISLRNISFSYTKHSSVIIKNVNLDIAKGEKVAIVGQSGSGKSTLAKLLVGLYIPTSGEIFYDNVDIKNIKKKSLRKQIGIVPQDVTLFNKSILDNIKMDRNDMNIDKIKKACKVAQIDDEIESMPMGYYTLISEMGMNLSGGQRQRIVLARAILNDPQILILDEATSSLDSINEKKLSDYFKITGCTRIVIAHRLSTIIDSDLIIVLDNGEIVEKGNHLELLNKKGKYYELYYSGNNINCDI